MLTDHPLGPRRVLSCSLLRLELNNNEGHTCTHLHMLFVTLLVVDVVSAFVHLCCTKIKEFLADPSKFVVAAAPAAAPEGGGGEEKKEEAAKEESEEESDEDMGMGECASGWGRFEKVR